MRITATQTFDRPPQWALLQRELIKRMDAAAEPVLEKYVRPDGTLLWPTTPSFKSIDGLDDAYESFHNWPLFYALGGDDKYLEISLREWEAITRQFARYDCGHGHPMVVKEYEQGYDWFHQGEGYLFLYMLGLADPANRRYRERAQRFAGFYLNEDPQAPNYDPERKLVRCAFVGSMGPAHRNFTRAAWGPAPWKEFYGLPYQDVPGCTGLDSIRDMRNAMRMARAMQKRMAYGDVATNLAITGMMTHAYLYSGESKYREWVREYVDAWMRRARENGGIIPDNVGLSGQVGETLDGKWYGGYYGWSWPHGWLSLGDAVTLAAENALLLTRDPGYLDLPRWQMDALIARGIVFQGTLHVPYKHGDPGKYEYRLFIEHVLTADGSPSRLDEFNRLLWKDGWFEFQPMHPKHAVHVWQMSQDESDLRRVRRIRNGFKRDWERLSEMREKDQGGHDAAWAAYLSGEYPDYPEQILRFNLAQVDRRLRMIQEDTQDPKTYSDAYLQHRNPITAEGLTHLTLGASLPLYNGGLLMAQVRHFDRERLRPGLPRDVAALVQSIRPEGLTLRLVNLSSTHTRCLTLQAGGYGEHRFTRAGFTIVHGGEAQPVELEVDDPYLEVDLPPGADLTLQLQMRRFVNDPGYRLPWNPGAVRVSH